MSAFRIFSNLVRVIVHFLCVFVCVCVCIKITKCDTIRYDTISKTINWDMASMRVRTEIVSDLRQRIHIWDQIFPFLLPTVPSIKIGNGTKIEMMTETTTRCSQFRTRKLDKPTKNYLHLLVSHSNRRKEMRLFGCCCWCCSSLFLYPLCR